MIQAQTRAQGDQQLPLVCGQVHLTFDKFSTLLSLDLQPGASCSLTTHYKHLCLVNTRDKQLLNHSFAGDKFVRNTCNVWKPL